MIETQPTVDTGCSRCGGVGWVREPWDGTRSPRDSGLVRCSCNLAPIDQVAESENVRVFSDRQRTKRQGDRRSWWAQ